MATSATLEQLAEAAASRRYPMSRDEASTGWGSIDDDDTAIGLPISIGVAAGRARVETDHGEPSDRRLRLRYYWAALESRAVRAGGGDRANWRTVNFLNAVDFSLYEESEGVYSGLVTMRTPAPFKKVMAAFNELVLTVDDSPEIITDTIPEVLSEDFFLWLVDREEAEGDIATGFKLADISEMSSKDRRFGSARFKDSANAERIEMAALIARGLVGLGPAKLVLTSELHEATFEVELHLDGGFQPLRSSDYEQVAYSPEMLGIALVDDIWTSVLPALRSAYDDDAAWPATRRAALREAALDTVCDLLGLHR